jgi:hypothetical protein
MKINNVTYKCLQVTELEGVSGKMYIYSKIRVSSKTLKIDKFKLEHAED